MTQPATIESPSASETRHTKPANGKGASSRAGNADSKSNGAASANAASGAKARATASSETQPSGATRSPSNDASRSAGSNGKDAAEQPRKSASNGNATAAADSKPPAASEQKPRAVEAPPDANSSDHGNSDMTEEQVTAGSAATPPATAKPAKALPPDRQKAVDQVLASVRKTYGKTSITAMNEDTIEPVRAIPTGSLALDEALGTGGYPRGRITEIYGPESSGKTTLTLHAIAEVQARGGVAAFIDAEHAFDLTYAQAIGVRPAQLLVSQPDYGEQALGIVEELVKSGTIDLIVVDSVAALVPKAEIDGDMGDLQPGSQARLMSKAMRKLLPLVKHSDTAVIFINQLRHKIGVIFGSPETTPGGNALKFFTSLRLDVRRTGKVQVGSDTIGNRTRVRAVKNKCARPFGEAEFDIRWGIGIDRAIDLIEVALAKGVLQKSGSHILLGGKSIGQGIEKTRDALLASPELRGSIELATFDALPPFAQRLQKVA